MDKSRPETPQEITDAEQMKPSVLASVLCNTEDSGLFGNPDMAEHVAKWLSKHFIVRPK